MRMVKVPKVQLLKWKKKKFENAMAKKYTQILEFEKNF